MPLNRSGFLQALRESVIHSKAIGEYPALQSFAVTPNIRELDSDSIADIASKAPNRFWSNAWAARGKQVDNAALAFPILALQPVDESLAGIGRAKVERSTVYLAHFLGPYQDTRPGVRTFAPYHIQDALSTHAVRTFALLSTICWATVDANPPGWELESVLQTRQAAGQISTYNLDNVQTNAARRRIQLPDSQGDYIDAFTKHNLFGLRYRITFTDCGDSTGDLLEANKLCC